MSGVGCNQEGQLSRRHTWGGTWRCEREDLECCERGVQSMRVQDCTDGAIPHERRYQALDMHVSSRGGMEWMRCLSMNLVACAHARPGRRGWGVENGRKGAAC